MHAGLLVLTSLLGGLPAEGGELPGDIGWCAFYPAVDVGMDRLPESGASILSVCAGGWSMSRGRATFDFSAFDRQLDYARKNHLKLALISETNPLYTPAWLRQEVGAAGQLVRNAQGIDGPIPSTTSPLFRAAQEELVQRFVEHVQRTDHAGTVAYYHPGAEWWFPLDQRYHPADVARFQEWLRERYVDIGRLNEVWQSRYSRFDEIPAPAIDMMGGGKGRTGLARVISLESGAQHCSWSTPAAMDAAAKPGEETFAEVEPGRSYSFSAWVKSQDVAGPGPFLEIAWVRPEGGPPIAIDDGPVRPVTSGWTHLADIFVAPPGSGRAWLLLKFMGTGTVVWDDVRFHAIDQNLNLAPNPDMEAGGEQPAAWRFQNWSGGQQVRARYRKSGGRTSGGCLQVDIPVAPEQDHVACDVDAAVYDWSIYWYETAADYINGLARLFKRYDPTRPTMTYLTMSWAFPVEWDETQRSAIAPDEVAMRGRDIDGFGMQLCSADGDPLRATACLDLVRKYGKPMWTVDLVDFTSGVDIGYQAMDRITQSVLQHGAAGIIYCAWHIPTVLDYSFYPHMDLNNTHQMLVDARRAVGIMAGLHVQPRGAILEPILPAAPSDPEGFKNDFRSFIGWYKLLSSLHETFDVVTLREIEQHAADLSRYRYLLVPDCACLPESVREQIGAYGRAGGVVILGGRFAERNEIGRALAPHTSSHIALSDFGKVYAGDPVRNTHAGNTPPLFLWRPETDATREAFKRGRHALRKCLVEAGIEQRIEILPDESQVRCVEWSGPDVQVAYLVNMSGEPIPAGWLKLRFPVAADQISVFADTCPAEGDRAASNWIALPAFRTSCIVMVRLVEHQGR